jgi:hypothetical protein
MKKLVSIFSCCIILCSYSYAQVTKTDDGKSKVKTTDDKMKVKDKTGMGNMAMPYSANYSSDFRIGNPAHAKMILELWKDYDDNMFDRHVSWFADTMQMIGSDGRVTKGLSANMEGVKKWRGSLTSAKSTVDAWIPLKSNDKNENWVAIWGTEVDTYPDGHTTSTEIHEIWRINKDGKVDFIKQYQGKSPEKP